jgi:hypothetical protein
VVFRYRAHGNGVSLPHRYRRRNGRRVAIRKELIGMITLTMTLVAVAAYLVAIDLEAYPRATRKPHRRG